MSVYRVHFVDHTVDPDYRYAQTPYEFIIAWQEGGTDLVSRAFDPYNRAKWREIAAWCEQRCGARGFYSLQNELVDGTWACTHSTFMLSCRQAALDFRLTW